MADRLSDFDPTVIPLLQWFDRLWLELFPPSAVRLLDVTLAASAWRRGTRRRFQKAGWLLRSVRDVRTLRQLDRHLRERATAKDLLSMHWYCLAVHNELARHPSQTLAFQGFRRELGRRPDRLRFLLAVLRYAARSQA